jgi:hypothetical protein
MKARPAKFLITAILALALSGTASAAIFANGSVAFSDFVSSYAGTNLAAATSITLANPGGFITATTGLPFSCAQTDCTPLGSATLTTPITFTVPLGVYVNFIMWGDGTGGANNSRYSFSSLLSSASSTGPDDLTITATGTFTDSLGVYATNTASLIFNFTQSGGPGHAISGSGTISTPEAFQFAPEPGTLFLMGGALVGIGLIRRRSQAG